MEGFFLTTQGHLWYGVIELNTRTHPEQWRDRPDEAAATIGA